MKSKVLVGGIIAAIILVILIVVTLVRNAILNDGETYDIEQDKNIQVEINEDSDSIELNDVEEQLKSYGDDIILNLEVALGDDDESTAVDLLMNYNQFAYESVVLIYTACYEKCGLELDDETLEKLRNSAINSVENQDLDLISSLDEDYSEQVKNLTTQVQLNFMDYYDSKSTPISFESNFFINSDYEDILSMLEYIGAALGESLLSGDERVGSVEPKAQ